MVAGKLNRHRTFNILQSPNHGIVVFDKSRKTRGAATSAHPLVVEQRGVMPLSRGPDTVKQDGRRKICRCNAQGKRARFLKVQKIPH